MPWPRVIFFPPDVLACFILAFLVYSAIEAARQDILHSLQHCRQLTELWCCGRIENEAIMKSVEVLAWEIEQKHDHCKFDL